MTLNIANHCLVRTTQVQVPTQGTGAPVQLPSNPLPGRKLLVIMNNDTRDTALDDPGNTRVLVGDSDVMADGMSGSTKGYRGYGLEKFESIALPVDDTTTIYAIRDNNPVRNRGELCDVRIMEIA